MTDEEKEKAKEISYHYLQQVDCFGKKKYDENDILVTARDAALEMAQWKNEQFKQIVKDYIDLAYNSGQEAHLLEDILKNL